MIAVREAGAGTVYVATTGKPYPLRSDEGKESYIDFSDFVQQFHITAPKGALSLDKILAS